MKSRFKIIYYKNKCIGCGACYERQPGRWRMSRKDGKANLIDSTVKKKIEFVNSMDSIQISLDIANACPMKAIKIIL